MAFTVAHIIIGVFHIQMTKVYIEGSAEDVKVVMKRCWAIKFLLLRKEGCAIDPRILKKGISSVITQNKMSNMRRAGKLLKP